VLAVATALVRAQPRTLIPFTNRFRWRWVGLGVMVMLGTSVIAVAGIAIAAVVVLGQGSAGGSLQQLGARAPGLAVGAGVGLLAAFALGGFAVARMSRGRTIAEPAVAAMAALAILGGAGSGLTGDSIIVAAVLALPCALAAAAGGWFGEISEREEPSP
jgi:hypothetical protein